MTVREAGTPQIDTLNRGGGGGIVPLVDCREGLDRVMLGCVCGFKHLRD